MELYYYKNREGNFGDDLNPYLWRNLIDNFDASKPDTLFVGIGTILTESFFAQHGHRQLLVFGSGSRGFYQNFTIPDSCKIVFVRGPLTAAVLNLPATCALTDPAYALRLLPSYKRITPQKGRTGFMPHYASIRRFNLIKRLCDVTGFLYIDPTAPVETVLANLSTCDHLISEAMHGAIIADSMRIPWTRVGLEVTYYEGVSINEFKWNDWMLSIRSSSDSVAIERPPLCRRRAHQLLNFSSNRRWIDHTAKTLSKLADKSRARLSTDTVHASVMQRIAEHIARLNAKSQE
jgi:succinoglycan biosynthesis protein ExoV